MVTGLGLGTVASAYGKNYVKPYASKINSKYANEIVGGVGIVAGALGYMGIKGNDMASKLVKHTFLGIAVENAVSMTFKVLAKTKVISGGASPRPEIRNEDTVFLKSASQAPRLNSPQVFEVTATPKSQRRYMVSANMI
ncbi:MAG: hypothetical protein GXO49_04100 [Chlorobi bacterium]|nr:hypothetical protein [Chlorobiota bacterium]